MMECDIECDVEHWCLMETRNLMVFFSVDQRLLVFNSISRKMSVLDDVCCLMAIPENVGVGWCFV